MRVVCLVIAGVLGLLVPQARAQGIGFQGGYSVDPDQVYVGSHLEHELARQFLIRPGVEGGWGDGLTLASINVEFLYKFELEGGTWSIYQGSGPSINLFRIDERTDVRGGLNVIFGVAHETGFFTEFRVGTANSPQLEVRRGLHRALIGSDPDASDSRHSPTPLPHAPSKARAASIR